MLVCALQVGRGLGPFVLGAPIADVIRLICTHKDDHPRVEVTVCEPAKDIEFYIPDHAIRLFFERTSQRLRLVEVCDATRLRLVCNGTLFGGASNPPTYGGLYSAFGPTYPCDVDPSTGLQPLLYPGFAALFEPSRHSVARASPPSATSSVPLDAPAVRLFVYPGSADSLSEALRASPAEWKRATAAATVHAVPGRGIRVGRTGSICLGDATQEVVATLGLPNAVFRKPLNGAGVNSGYIYNYFRRGIDVVFNARHRVIKLVLHANAPLHREFGVYSKCHFQVCVGPAANRLLARDAEASKEEEPRQKHNSDVDEEEPMEVLEGSLEIVGQYSVDRTPAGEGEGSVKLPTEVVQRAPENGVDGCSGSWMVTLGCNGHPNDEDQDDYKIQHDGMAPPCTPTTQNSADHACSSLPRRLQRRALPGSAGNSGDDLSKRERQWECGPSYRDGWSDGEELARLVDQQADATRHRASATTRGSGLPQLQATRRRHSMTSTASEDCEPSAAGAGAVHGNGRYVNQGVQTEDVELDPENGSVCSRSDSEEKANAAYGTCKCDNRDTEVCYVDDDEDDTLDADTYHNVPRTRTCGTQTAPISVVRKESRLRHASLSATACDRGQESDAFGLVTVDGTLEDIGAAFGDVGRPIMHPAGAVAKSSHGFQPTQLYGFPGVVFEVLSGGGIASITLFDPCGR